MIIILGLGNPEKKYQKTRHNLGFRVLDEFQKEKKSYFFSEFSLKNKLKSLVSEGKINDEKIILAKPQTFMNNSGQAANPLVKNYFFKKNKESLNNFFWTVHDDIDLPLGKIRISKNRGAAGHKGIESIIKNLGTKNFTRFRIGISPKSGKPKNTERFVLENFNQEKELIEKIIKKACQIIDFSLKENLEKSMNKYNK